MEASDAEWQVLAPKLGKIMALERQRDRYERPKSPPPPPKPAQPATAGKVDNGGKPDKPDKPDKGGKKGRGDPKLDLKSDLPPGTPGADMAEQLAMLTSLSADPNARLGEMKDTLTRYRRARAEAAEELTKARDELRELLTVKQEVVLVVLGILD